MEKEKIVVGLDIGTTKIAAIVGRLNEYGKLEVLGFFVAQVEREGLHQVFREAPGIAGDVMTDAVHHEDLELPVRRAGCPLGGLRLQDRRQSF